MAESTASLLADRLERSFFRCLRTFFLRGIGPGSPRRGPVGHVWK
jgi:hypothetical protein